MLPLKMKCQETGFTIATERTKTKPDKISKHTHLEMGLTKKEIIGSY